MSKRGPGANFGGDEERFGGPGPGNDVMDKPTKATDAQLARRKIAQVKKATRPGASRGNSPFVSAPAGSNAPQSFNMAAGNGAGNNGNAFAFGGSQPTAFNFGATEASQPNPFTSFNSTQTAPASTPSFTGFGQSQQSTTTASSNPFGQSQPAAASQPSFTGFGQTQTAPTNTSSFTGFGQTQTAPPASTPAFTGFGQSQPATTTSSNPFGQQQPATANSTTFPGFGQSKPVSTSSNPFSGFPTQDNSRANTPAAASQPDSTQQSLFGNLNQAKPESEKSSGSLFAGIGQQPQQNGTSNLFAGFNQPQAEPPKANPFASMTQPQSSEPAKANNPFQGFGQTQSESSRASTPFAAKQPESEKPNGLFSGIGQQQNGTSNIFNFGQKEAEPAKTSNLFANIGQAAAEPAKSNPFAGFGQAQSESSRASTPFAAVKQPEPEKPKDLFSGFKQKPQQNGTMETPKTNGEKVGLFGSTITAPTAQAPSSGGSIFDSIPKKAPSNFTFSSADPKQVYREEDDDDQEDVASSSKSNGAEAASSLTPKPAAPRSLFDRIDKVSDSQDATATPKAAPQNSFFGSINKSNGETPKAAPPMNLFGNINKETVSQTPKAAPPQNIFGSTNKVNGGEAFSQTPKTAPTKSLFDRVDKDDGKKQSSNLSKSTLPPATPEAAPATRALTAPPQQSPTSYSHPPLSDLKKVAALKNLNEGVIAQLKNQDPTEDLSTIFLFAAYASANIMGVPPPSIDAASTAKLPAPPSSGNGGSNMFSGNAAQAPPSTNGSSASAAPSMFSQNGASSSGSMFNANTATPKSNGQSLFSKPPSTAPPGKKRPFEDDEESSVQPATEKRAKPTSMTEQTPKPTSISSPTKQRGFEQDDESPAQPSTEKRNKPSYPEMPPTASKTARLFDEVLKKSETAQPSTFSGFKPSTSSSGFTPSAPASSGFKPAASTTSPTKPATSSEAAASTTKPAGGLTLPTFTAAPTNFLSSFGAAAKKNEEEARQARMEGDYDSDEGSKEEWLKRDREEQEKKRQKILDAAKSGQGFKVPTFGATTTTSTDAASGAPNQAEKLQGKGDKSYTTATPIKFGITSDTPSATPATAKPGANIFGSLNTTTPATAKPSANLFGSLNAATPATTKPSSNLFGSLNPTTPAAPTPSGSVFGATPAAPVAGEGSDKDEEESAEDPSVPQDDLAGLLPAELKENSILMELQDTKTKKLEQSDQVGADGKKSHNWNAKASGRLFVIKNKENGKIRILCKAPQGQVLLNYNPMKGSKYTITGKKGSMVTGDYMDHIYESPAKPGRFVVTAASADDAKELARYLNEGASQ